MSAFEDIRHALGAATVKRKGWVRVIFVGISAERSLETRPKRDDEPPFPARIDHIEVRRTTEFDGWAIRDMDPAGKWHDVEPAA